MSKTRQLERLLYNNIFILEKTNIQSKLIVILLN